MKLFGKVICLLCAQPSLTRLLHLLSFACFFLEYIFGLKKFILEYFMSAKQLLSAVSVALGPHNWGEPIDGNLDTWVKQNTSDTLNAKCLCAKLKYNIYTQKMLLPLTWPPSGQRQDIHRLELKEDFNVTGIAAAETVLGVESLLMPQIFPKTKAKGFKEKTIDIW